MTLATNRGVAFALGIDVRGGKAWISFNPQPNLVALPTDHGARRTYGVDTGEEWGAHEG